MRGIFKSTASSPENYFVRHPCRWLTTVKPPATACDPEPNPCLLAIASIIPHTDSRSNPSSLPPPRSDFQHALKSTAHAATSSKAEILDCLRVEVRTPSAPHPPKISAQRRTSNPSRLHRNIPLSTSASRSLACLFR